MEIAEDEIGDRRRGRRGVRMKSSSSALIKLFILTDFTHSLSLSLSNSSFSPILHSLSLSLSNSSFFVVLIGSIINFLLRRFPPPTLPLCRYPPLLPRLLPPLLPRFLPPLLPRFLPPLNQILLLGILVYCLNKLGMEYHFNLGKLIFDRHAFVGNHSSYLKGSPELDIIMRYLSLKQMCLRKFTLRVSLGDPYKVPSTFFQLKHLTHVELFSCVLKPDDDFCGFENLTSLNLFRVRISFNGLISFLKNCKRLTSLILMTHDGDLHEPSTFGFEELAASIPNIKHLQLGSCPFRLLSACGGLRVQHSSFNKLKSLRLTGVCFTLNLDLRGIQYLVTNSLELEKLEIMEFCQLKDMPVGVVDLSCHPRKMVYLNKLRSVEIQRFDCFGKGVDLIKFIMIRSPNLK
ncbi:unnamed protein product [Lactuca virosa]|uniref:F-box/LRR-repeat protein 15/At3g58940/PEG3-like LRR domain-containing protein n=1 Tax=Lactuca virosa TaxID=75947 RepID=A0AAU9LR42_9ASTR|nr:unnamed protein product [Lactuca virosa]